MESDLYKTMPTKPRPQLPVDKGWAWLVMLGASINMMFGYGFMRSLSIFFLEFLDRFKESATLTTLAFGLNTAATSVFSFLVPPLFLSRFSVRTVTLIGAFINAFSIIALALAPNMTYVYVIFIALGAANPMIYISQVTLLGVYFKKRLSLAVACANVGVSVATMCGPPLTQYLLDEYGLQGALLIHGALNLHNIAACLLFRPPSFYATTTTIINTTTTHITTTYDSNVDVEDSESYVQIDTMDSHQKGDASSLVSEHDLLDDENSDYGKGHLLSVPKLNAENPHYRFLDKHNTECQIGNERKKSKSLYDLLKFSLANNYKVDSCIIYRNGRERYTGSERNIAGPNIPSTLKSISSLSRVAKSSNTSNSSLCINANGTTVPFPDNDEPIFQGANSEIASSVIKMEHDVDTNKMCCCYASGQSLNYKLCLSKFKSIPTHEPTSNSNANSDSMIRNEIIINNESPSYSKTCCDKLCCSCFVSCCSSSTKATKFVWCRPIVILLILISGIGIHTPCATAYMPSLGKEQGLFENQLPILMTVIGASDLCKIAIGYFADKGCMRRIHIVLLCQLMIGITFQFVSYFDSFVSMVIFCAILGANSEVMYVLLPGVTVDLLGAEFIGQVIAGFSIVHGMLTSLNHVLIGWMKDETGSFIGGYQLIGGFMLCSAILSLLEPVINLFVSPETKLEENEADKCSNYSEEYV